MGAAISLRNDFDAKALRRLAKTSKDANQGRRLLSLAVIYDGGCPSRKPYPPIFMMQTIQVWMRFS